MATNTDNKPHVYFPALDTTRFLWCMVVLVLHVDFIQGIFFLTSATQLHPYIISFAKPTSIHMILGETGISYFFMLSGFLISYLLLTEKKHTGTIALKTFYLKRVFRILPLYYLIVVLALFILPHIPFFDVPFCTSLLQQNFVVKATFFLLMLPNLGFMLQPLFPYLSQSWSVGVEEMFYLFWAPLMKRTTRYITLFVAIIVIYVILNARMTYTLNITYTPLYFMRFSCMAIGGLYAYCLFFNKTAILAFLYHRYVQVIIWLLLIGLFSMGIYIPYIHHEVYVTLMGVLMLNATSNPRTLFRFDYPLTNYLGQRSYGIYMYHFIAISIAIKFTQFIFGDHYHSLPATLTVYAASIAFTLLIAIVSYRYFELPFLRLKNKIAPISSGKYTLKQ